ncbi:hypothetical protein B0I35DRAFT_415108 [Stachybotrys elegans]|uniref:Uncharacterized protein n=1 Tax=Stachybotrys elegans TaxID=80388 RepID=A0A8K0SD92_9HYPO|nr:hypothetical protein B0I35DRAFT_415108 [Stachybotrys elegans]
MVTCPALSCSLAAAGFLCYSWLINLLLGKNRLYDLGIQVHTSPDVLSKAVRQFVHITLYVEDKGGTGSARLEQTIQVELTYVVPGSQVNALKFLSDLPSGSQAAMQLR